MAPRPKPPKDSSSVTKLVEECEIREKVFIVVEVKSYFRIRHPDRDGKINITPSVGNPDKRIGGLLFGVLNATVKINGITDKTSKNNDGKNYTPAVLDVTSLKDGTYTLEVEPDEERKHEKEAGPETTGKETKPTSYLTGPKKGQPYKKPTEPKAVKEPKEPKLPNKSKLSEADYNAAMKRYNEKKKEYDDKKKKYDPYKKKLDEVIKEIKASFNPAFHKAVKDITARKYRSMRASVTIKNRKVAEAHSILPVDPYKPWESNYANAWAGPYDDSIKKVKDEGKIGDKEKNMRIVASTVFIDLKPDWWSSPSASCMKMGDRSEAIDLIVLHNTGVTGDGKNGGPRLEASFGEGLRRWGAHYYVDLDGHVIKIYNESKIWAYHAGPANYRSIGIEIIRPMDGFQELTNGGVKPLKGLQLAQFESVKNLVTKLQKKFDIPDHRIIGHCDVEKNTCPGCDLWWELLEEKGLGMVLAKELTAPGKESAINDIKYKIWFKEYKTIESKFKNKIVRQEAVLVKGKIVKSEVVVKGSEVMESIAKDLKDIGYAGDVWKNEKTTAIKRFQFHFYTGSRYRLRPKAKKAVKFPRNSGDKGKTGGKEPGNIRPNVDSMLAMRIRNVADTIRKIRTDNVGKKKMNRTAFTGKH